MSDEIEVQRLREARVCTVKGDANNNVVISVTGNVDTYYFAISSDDFLRLTERFVQDAKLLTTRPDGRSRPS